MRYTIKIDREALKALACMPAKVQRQIARRIDELADNPHPADAIQIKGGNDFWRIRCGNYRIAYQVRRAVLLILVVRVGHRKDFYRYFDH
jgi:mRNA interferase RelE/StbE